MTEEYKPKYIPSDTVFRAGSDLAMTSITNAEIIDRVVFGYKDMAIDDLVPLLIALTLNGYMQGQSELQLELVNVQHGLIEAWVDTGCECPKCVHQRSLRSQQTSGKPN
jgi:hypothetical protein